MTRRAKWLVGCFGFPGSLADVDRPAHGHGTYFCFYDISKVFNSFSLKLALINVNL